MLDEKAIMFSSEIKTKLVLIPKENVTNFPQIALIFSFVNFLLIHLFQSTHESILTWFHSHKRNFSLKSKCLANLITRSSPFPLLSWCMACRSWRSLEQSHALSLPIDLTLVHHEILKHGDVSYDFIRNNDLIVLLDSTLLLFNDVHHESLEIIRENCRKHLWRNSKKKSSVGSSLQMNKAIS